jgi:hypothetical protein
MMGGERETERERESTIFTLLWVIRNLSASETMTSSWICTKLVLERYTGQSQSMMNKRKENRLKDKVSQNIQLSLPLLVLECNHRNNSRKVAITANKLYSTAL